MWQLLEFDQKLTLDMSLSFISFARISKNSVFWIARFNFNFHFFFNFFGCFTIGLQDLSIELNLFSTTVIKLVESAFKRYYYILRSWSFFKIFESFDNCLHICSFQILSERIRCAKELLENFIRIPNKIIACYCFLLCWSSFFKSFFSILIKDGLSLKVR